MRGIARILGVVGGACVVLGAGASAAQAVVANPTVTITAPGDGLYHGDVHNNDMTATITQFGFSVPNSRTLSNPNPSGVASGPHAGDIWRPYHPFVNSQQVPLQTPVKYEIEIFPLGHVFRAGHELVLQLHAPPPLDPLSIGSYPPEQTPAVVHVLADTEHQSSVLLPFLSTLPPQWPTPPDCSAIAGEQCVTPAASVG